MSSGVLREASLPLAHQAADHLCNRRTDGYDLPDRSAPPSLGAAARKCRRADYPVAAVKFINEKNYSGPLYNHFNWGGYLIWALPRVPVSMDGRMNLHGDQRIERSVNTWSGLRGWESDPELMKARLVIGSVNDPLTNLMRTYSRFKLVYEDAVAAVCYFRGQCLVELKTSYLNCHSRQHTDGRPWSSTHEILAPGVASLRPKRRRIAILTVGDPFRFAGWWHKLLE